MRDTQQEQTADIRESRKNIDVADDAGLIRGESGEGGFAAKKTPKSSLYFIQCDGPSRPIKIGHARVVERRLSALQMGCPWTLTLLGSVTVDNAEAVEERLHYRFAKTRIRGEWFAATAELLDLTKRVARYRDEALAAYLGGLTMPVPPIELLVTGSLFDVEQVDPEIESDVAREVGRIRRAEHERAAAIRESRRALEPSPRQREPGPGEFMWRGKIRTR